MRPQDAYAVHCPEVCGELLAKLDPVIAHVLVDPQRVTVRGRERGHIVRRKPIYAAGGDDAGVRVIKPMQPMFVGRDVMAAGK